MIKTAEEFVRLRESENPEEYIRSSNESADISVWIDVIEKYPHMHQWVAYNKTVPREILKILAYSNDWRVRNMVAMRRAAGPEILSLLMKDESEAVRSEVAYNAKVTKEILEYLLTDESEDIREVAAEKLAKMSDE